MLLKTKVARRRLEKLENSCTNIQIQHLLRKLSLLSLTGKNNIFFSAALSPSSFLGSFKADSLPTCHLQGILNT